MKVVILAGGYGTRISEETHLKPKPMVEIGGKPILWHIMKLYSHYGFNDFIICLGYKGYVIKEYFANYFLYMSDVTFNMKNNEMIIHQVKTEPWKVSLVDTGQDTLTGGRIQNIREYVGKETFCMTYGDGLSNINIRELVNYHKEKNKFATVTAVQPPGRFGALVFQGENVVSFQEKPEGDGHWVNGGFFVLEPEVFNFIKDENTIWEKEPLEELAKQGQLVSYRHKDFWHPMDTLRDQVKLEDMWKQGAPWRVWQDVK